MAPTWMEGDGLHAILPGDAPTPGEMDVLTRKYQEGIRQSPLWDRMLKEYGPEEAERLLLLCKAEVRA
jgi:hypothetical protein